MDTRLYKRGGSSSVKPRRIVDELLVRPERALSFKTLRKVENCPQDAKKLIAVNLANRVYNIYRGYIKFGKMNLRIHTKDNGIVIVIKHEW